jgi:hypothetical protein
VRAGRGQPGRVPGAQPARGHPAELPGRLRPFRNLFASQAISLLGSAIAPVALAFAILDSRGGSASELGFVLAARSLGQVTFLLLGGVLADRLPRFRLMATSRQTHIPNDALARISSYDMLGSFVLGPLGLLAVGPIAAAIGVTPTLIGACAILTAATVVPLLTSAVRDLPAEPQPAAPSPLLY